MKQLDRIFLFWAALLLVWELVFHITAFGAPSLNFFYSIIFSLSLAALLAMLSQLCPARRANSIVRYVLLAIFFTVFAVQTVYYQVFGSLLSLVYVGMGGQAIGGFLPVVIGAIGRSIPQLIIYILPFPLLAQLHRRGILDRDGRGRPFLLALFCASLLLFSIASAAVSLNSSASRIYEDAHATVDQQAGYFGLTAAERLELERMARQDISFAGTTLDLTGGSWNVRPEQRNIMQEIDFGKLDAAADNEMLRSLNTYISGLSGTTKNEYTGMFEGYNLIEICAEAFSPYLVSEELTPTLYRMSHEGIVFTNFYNSFPSLTTNGEYTMCMGLLPDLSRLSFATSVDNYVPFCLGNRFQTVGVQPLAYHNNIGTFYNRINTHTNMGYDFRAINFGLDMERLTPSSDLVMMETSVDDYIGQEPFMVHYMTYSGHMDYNFTSNSMSIKNRERVEQLDCSETLKAYYACQLELEDAVTYLIERLEEAGIADHTVIVLSSDHYPYGLPDEVYEELAGDATSEPFWRYRNSFICWTGGMEEPLIVEDYCCSQDILPTLLNLFNLSYDSRMLTGTDIFSDSTHIAVLQDGSFLTEGLRYDSSSNEITYLQPQEDFPEGYAEELIQAVRNEFSVSSAILRSDYYGFVFSTLGLADTEANHKTYASYADIAGTWYEEAVEGLTGRGALTGTSSGNFCGDQLADRATFLTMLTRTLYLETPPEAPPYTDLSADSWYYNAFASAWAAGLLPEDGTECRPTDPLTPEEARTLFAAAAAYAELPDSEQWAAQVVDEVLSEAQQQGEDTEILSRAAAAAIIYRLVLNTE